MIKRKLKLAGALLSVAGAFCLASCGSNSSAENQPVVNSTDTINEKVETKQKYVIELNIDNYKKYIDLKFITGFSGNYSYTYYYFQGSLPYAFYDNVIVTYTVSGESEASTLALSSGGYARYYTSSLYSTEHTITNVSGKVIYWI